MGKKMKKNQNLENSKTMAINANKKSNKLSKTMKKKNKTEVQNPKVARKGVKNQKSPKNKSGKSKKQHKKKGRSLSEDVFALGGDEEDLALIADVDDHEEEGDEAGPSVAVQELEDLDGSFSAQARKELEAFIQSLGLDKKFEQGMPKEEEHEEAHTEEESSDDEQDEKNEVQVDEVSSSTTNNEEVESSIQITNFHFVKDQPQRKHCLFKPGQKWHSVLETTDEEEETMISEYWLAKLQKYADSLFTQECVNFQRQQKTTKDSEMSYVNTVLKSGALKDKISA